MAEEGFKRKLTTIFSADVVGYSRLMENNEEATIQTLNIYRNSMSTLVEQHGGRVVDMTGDNLMAEFASVVDAVKCAVETQKEIGDRNADLPEKRRMLFRIGVNLGDIVEEDGRIYGDGVNIAARLEGLAEGGGICISGTVYDQLKNKLELGYEYLGEHSVKNIAAPVRVYKVLMESEAVGKLIGEKRFLGRFSRRAALAAIIALAIVAGGLIGWNIYLHQSKKIKPASLDKMAYPLPEIPSIAVLPFVNMTEDPKQEYLSDGITEQIITTLSQAPRVFVISRTSTFTYKNSPVKVQQVSEELGVRYVLEGSVQRSGDQIRVTAQLIDAIDGKHIWAKRYDRQLKDVFKLQDELTFKIINALRVKLTDGEQANLWGKNHPSNIEYIEKLYEGIDYLREFNKEANIKAKQLFKEAVDLEPGFWRAYAALATTYYMDVWLGSSSSRRESLGKAFKLCNKAMTLDESQFFPHSLLSQIYSASRKYDMAIKEGQRAIAMNPNSADAYVWLAISLNFAGRPEEAIDSIKKAMRLSPFPPAYYMLQLGMAYKEAGHYEEAIAEFKKCIKLRPNNIIAYSGLSNAYALAGRYEEAREAWSEVLKIAPKYSVEEVFTKCPYLPESCVRNKAAMDRAGIK
jgi:adenylate cyclase